jgi:hypothetical protein
LIDEINRLSSPSPWNKEFSRIGDLKPNNLDDVFGSLDSSMLSQLQSPQPSYNRQNINQLRASYPTNVSSSPVRKPSSFGFDSSAAVAAAVMNSRSAAFAKRSQSFVDRGAGNHRGFTAGGNSLSTMSSGLSDWSSPNGKLDWGIQGDELSKLQKSASFGFRDNNVATTRTFMPSAVDEPDVSWVNSLVKDVSHDSSGLFRKEQQQYNQVKGGHEMIPPWVEQLYIDQEQMVA